MTSRHLLLRFGLLGLLLASVPVSAQNAPNQNPQAALQQVNGPVSPSVNLPLPLTATNQNSDLAGLQPVNKYPVPKTFTVSTTQSVFWTDNAFVSNEAPKISSFGYNSRLMAAYVPYSTYDWTPSISFEQQFVRYDHTSILDFDGETVSVASKYDLVHDKSWSWTASDSLQRLYTSRDNLGEFYKENLLANELDYVHAIFNQPNLFFLGSYNVGWRLTDPNRYCRVDNTLVASVVYVPVREVRLEAYFSPAIYAYTSNEELDFTTGTIDTQGRGRTDYNASLGVMATYSPIKEVSLNANFNWIGNYSNVGDREYQTIAPALTLSGTIGF